MWWIITYLWYGNGTHFQTIGNFSKKSRFNGASWKGKWKKSSLRNNTPKVRQKSWKTLFIFCLFLFFLCLSLSQSLRIVLQANSWCARGIELLGSQRIENCSMSPEYAEESLQKIQQFVLSASEFCSTSSPRELRNIFQESSTPETRALVTQVRYSGMWMKFVLFSFLLLFLKLFYLFGLCRALE